MMYLYGFDDSMMLLKLLDSCINAVFTSTTMTERSLGLNVADSVTCQTNLTQTKTKISSVNVNSDVIHKK